jgi:hypothetical protein
MLTDRVWTVVELIARLSDTILRRDPMPIRSWSLPMPVAKLLLIVAILLLTDRPYVLSYWVYSIALIA